MARNQPHAPRKPATKFAHLRKKLEQRKIAARSVSKGNRSSNNR